MPRGPANSSHLPASAHESEPWRIREILPDFRLEDVWALPVHGGPGEFREFLGIATSLDPSRSDSRAARFLWEFRNRLGAWFGLGRASFSEEGGGSGGAERAEPLPIPGTGEVSVAERLPADLRGTLNEGDFASSPFAPLYVTDREAAAELSNRTVHGVVHFGWAREGDGRCQGRMAVYVKPRGRLGEAYMAAIRPFRHRVVYPALMRQFESAWAARKSEGPG